ncbi:hypothetical protein ACIQF6_24800 [Kitasatospora sp. NPDC092948]|uniref:hypothetical protein n=1 Tax=Kitasatospora sp. NPDC092948 TaxID=3364088 RepID=UPI00380ADFFA
MTVHGRTGHQVRFDGVELIGRKPSAVDADISRCIRDRDLNLRGGGDFDSGPGESEVWVRVERAGDASVSAASFCVEGSECRG